MVELVTGFGFVLIYVLLPDLLGPHPYISDTTYYMLYIIYCVLFSFFVVLFFTDLEYGILPDKIVFPATIAALAWRTAPLVFSSKSLILNTSYWMLPAFGLAFFFLLLIIITRGRGMGFGDVKLGFLIGLVLGWPQTLVAAVLAFLFGGLVSVILLIGGRKHFGETVPFGPFLIAGTAIAALFGIEIWNWYIGLL